MVLHAVTPLLGAVVVQEAASLVVGDGGCAAPVAQRSADIGKREAGCGVLRRDPAVEHAVTLPAAVDEVLCAEACLKAFADLFRVRSRGDFGSAAPEKEVGTCSADTKGSDACCGEERHGLATEHAVTLPAAVDEVLCADACLKAFADLFPARHQGDGGCAAPEGAVGKRTADTKSGDTHCGKERSGSAAEHAVTLPAVVDEVLCAEACLKGCVLAIADLFRARRRG